MTENSVNSWQCNYSAFPISVMFLIGFIVFHVTEWQIISFKSVKILAFYFLNNLKQFFPLQIMVNLTVTGNLYLYYRMTDIYEELKDLVNLPFAQHFKSDFSPSRMC